MTRRRRIDYDPHDGTQLSTLLTLLAEARHDDPVARVQRLHRAEDVAALATGEAIAAALAAGYSARSIATALGLTHAAVMARARTARAATDTAED